MRKLLLLSAFVLVLPASAATERYVLAYATCSGSTCAQTLVQSRDGVRFTPLGAAAPGSHPSLARRGSDLYVVDGLAVTPTGLSGTVRKNLGTQQPLAVQLANPADAQTASAVSGAVTLDDAGALTIVYALRYEPSANACPVPGQACVKLRTATEQPGSNGTAYSGDPGNRYTLSFAATDTATAPFAFHGRDRWLILVSGPGGCLRVLATKSLHSSWGQLNGCLAKSTGAATAFWNARLAEYWFYAESDGKVVRAVAKRVDQALPATAFRPTTLRGSAPSFSG